MTTEIRRCLYIGLGGTGMKALLHTKKMFIDTYGEVPPMIGFLGIDTDVSEYKDTLTSTNGDKVTLSPNEHCQVSICGDAHEIYKKNRDHFSWIPSENLYALGALSNQSQAGAIRTNGRFAFDWNINSLVSSITAKNNAILSARIADNSKYMALDNAAPEVHMVFSVCGGTGAGLFLNMACLLRHLLPSSVITGYAILPGAFLSMAKSGMGRVTTNAYASLHELDYMMHLGVNHSPVSLLSINNKVQYVTKSPFDSVILVDNQNASLDTYNNVSDLAEMISLALVTSSAPFTDKSKRTSTNLMANRLSGEFNVRDKQAWAGGLGACEIIYNGAMLADIYKMKAAQHIITRLRNSCTDSTNIATAWIDEMRIRENNNHDDVINYIANGVAMYPLYISKQDINDLRYLVDDNIRANEIHSELIAERVNVLLENTRKGLRDLIAKHINNECGVSASKDIIHAIMVQIEICRKEMLSEKESISSKLHVTQTSIDALVKDIAGMNSIFQIGRRERFCMNLVEEVKIYNEWSRGVLCREAAITFYNQLLKTLNEICDKVKCIDEKLRSVNTNLTNKINTKQAGVAKNNNIFQVNLAEEDAKHITVKAEDIIMSEFFDSLHGEKLLEFYELSVRDIEQALVNYATTLNGTNSYANRSVESVLSDMRDKDKQAFDRLLNFAVDKAQPLLRYSYRGERPVAEATLNLIVGVCDTKNSVINGHNGIMKSVIGQLSDVDFVSTGMKDRVVFYCQLGVLPLYTVHGINKYRSDSEAIKNYDPYIDAQLHKRIVREEFDINPKEPDTLDMIEWWVKGFVYGLIKFENSNYYMKSRKLGSIVYDYWYKLSEYRDEAYEEFTKLDGVIVDEFGTYIFDKNNRMGAESVEALIADVKENYLTKYSQLNIPLADLELKQNKPILELIEAEGRYLEKW